jgi:hypothetical protein
MFEMRSLEDVIQVAQAGGGFTMHASARRTEDLVRIAQAAAGSGVKVTFTGLETRRTEDLVKIALAGRGEVSFA